MFSEKKDPVYDAVNWLTPENKNLYIHRLAVHPKSQKQGITRQLMDFAEDFGKKNWNQFVWTPLAKIQEISDSIWPGVI